MDFTKLSEVRALADQLLAKYPRIDVLRRNNAARTFSRRRRATQDGHEITFQVNYLASYLLTTRLLDCLIESQATVMFTSSIANSALGRIAINDLYNEANYSPLKAYGDSSSPRYFSPESCTGATGKADWPPSPSLLSTSFPTSPSTRALHLAG